MDQKEFTGPRFLQGLSVSHRILTLRQVDGYDDTLGAKPVRSLLYDGDILQRCGLHADLGCTGIKKLFYILETAYTATGNDGNIHLSGYRLDDGNILLKSLSGCLAVEKCHGIRTGIIIKLRFLYGIIQCDAGDHPLSVHFLLLSSGPSVPESLIHGC